MKDLDPIIILSASTRMGTTLVQRLLCSSKDCLIYGDTVGNEAAFFTSWLATKQMMLSHQGGRNDAMLRAVLSGDTSEFIAELAPESTGHLAQMAKIAAAPLLHCKDEAASHGRHIWGWKLAGAQAWFIRMLPAMLPKARVVWVDRGFEATARSAKAAGHVGEGEDFQRFIADAHANRTALATLTGVPIFRLPLEDLLENPAVVLSDLESFSGCSAIDRSVLSVKVNHPHSPWIAPAELSEEEIAFVRQFESSPSHALVA